MKQRQQQKTVSNLKRVYSYSSRCYPSGYIPIISCRLRRKFSTTTLLTN